MPVLLSGIVLLYGVVAADSRLLCSNGPSSRTVTCLLNRHSFAVTSPQSRPQSSYEPFMTDCKRWMTCTTPQVLPCVNRTVVKALEIRSWYLSESRKGKRVAKGESMLGQETDMASRMTVRLQFIYLSARGVIQRLPERTRQLRESMLARRTFSQERLCSTSVCTSLQDFLR